ncbi:brefeldin A-inhibited guanine nucleotide-exchange protein 1-like [Zingiber officinale]|uniref:brefeldin A-inhibited guanine nucleotide-exchange protein 1-like n=1 Tax=Zingiber officinale TaxID=94328 RepID=UPI001C4C5A6E|nr:brefeldin A-inhibited guanine nucleotide-exchange protein 1-like [Zingiber officinale]
MASFQPLGGSSRSGRILAPALDKIIKNAAWRKHSNLVSACKAALDRLETFSDSPDHSSPLLGIPPPDADFVLHPLVLAIESAYPKVTETALECAQKLFSHGLLRGDINLPADADNTLGSSASRLLTSVCSCCGIGDEALELSMLRVFIASVRSPFVLIRDECLAQIIRSCYNVYLGSQSGANQLCAKLVLAQIVVIMFTRVEADSPDVRIRIVSIADMMDLSDRNLNDSSLVQSAQNFINEVMAGRDADPLPSKSNKEVSLLRDAKGEAVANGGGLSKIREDGLFLFKNLCKLSMKFSTQENPEDPLLMRGKVLSLELLKIGIETAGPLWRANEWFLGAIKQYLCLSLLKNSALSVMSIFQLLCSIFMGLLSKFRSGLKEEVGIFFPMLILRILENILQPSFLQKMIVLDLLEKICQVSQIMVDIFVNYDCDVNSPNIFERVVNGLLKTALGVPPGSATSLSPAQNTTLRIESVKCLNCIIKSMGVWMDQQLRLGDFAPESRENEHSSENLTSLNGEEGSVADHDLHSDANHEPSDTASLEQRRAYKLEFQKGVALFNKKPSKGIDFLIKIKKIGASPEEVASFLKNASGLNPSVVGDYLGEREDFSLKVMHAYVDSINFEGMNFGEAIRFFLKGFRLPGEAQKIDRIMEKFAERYSKCNPSSFTSADTAYVLAYSVIMLNTDAHNNMVKDKMSKSEFIRNNRGIDDGKDLPEEYLGSLYDQIVKSEIKISADISTPQNKQTNGINKLLGFDNIFNLVNWKQSEEKALGASDHLIKHIQEQFKAKSGKSESMFYTVTDTAILRFMMEACWAPLMAAFSMTLDQSDDMSATAQCLQGFRYAVHVTSVMHMQTQRDAFVTSVAKFTYLHCAADMKQKNVDAVKAIISIAIGDGNYLQESWEHIFTCLSRFEHLHLLGEGAPPDSSFFTAPLTEAEDRAQKITSVKKKGNALQNPAVMAVVRGGSYDSASMGNKVSALVTPDQMNNFISNLNLLDQIGTFELNHIFAHSQRLNGDAIVAFVRALCKVSMTELQSPTDPRVFSLTKIVEIAHYNMNRIRLVWSCIWNVLSEFFVSVGLSENLSVAIFVMDSLRQLAMKFLEREELANYNFQNEFLKPFVVIMQKSNSSEIRELIVRCVSQMVLSCVNHVKSGWKSVFMVFTTAAADERKSIVLLAFETMEKIVRDYFPYITETETTAFTDCVKCLIAFTNSRFNSDASLNAIAFLRFCAVKLAEGGLVCYDNISEGHLGNRDGSDGNLTEKDDLAFFWLPLLKGLSKLTSDTRPTIRKGALEVLFDILNDHGHLFTDTFWINILKLVIYPIFSNTRNTTVGQVLSVHDSLFPDNDSAKSETDTLAAKCLIDLFVNFFEVLQSHLGNVVGIVTSFVSSPYKQYANAGMAALLHLTTHLGSKLSEEEWKDILVPLKKSAASMLPVFSSIIRVMQDIEIPDRSHSDEERYSDHEYINEDEEEANMETTSYAIVRMKNHISVQLQIVQVVKKLYEVHRKCFSAAHVSILLDILTSIASHSSEVSSETTTHQKLQKACSLLEIPDPPVVHFENESYRNLLKFLQTILIEDPALSDELKIESLVVFVCQKIFKIYLNCAGRQPTDCEISDAVPTVHGILHLGSAKKEELAARTSLLVLALQVLGGLRQDSFRRNLRIVFPSMVSLVSCEHSSNAVQDELHDIFHTSIGPLLMNI